MSGIKQQYWQELLHMIDSHPKKRHHNNGETLHSVTQKELPTAPQSLDRGVLDGDVPMDGNKVELSCERCSFKTSKLFIQLYRRSYQ